VKPGRRGEKDGKRAEDGEKAASANVIPAKIYQSGLSLPPVARIMSRLLDQFDFDRTVFIDEPGIERLNPFNIKLLCLKYCCSRQTIYDTCQHHCDTIEFGSVHNLKVLIKLLKPVKMIPPRRDSQLRRFTIDSTSERTLFRGQLC
jgi:hypothetical protein